MANLLKVLPFSPLSIFNQDKRVFYYFPLLPYSLSHSSSFSLIASFLSLLFSLTLLFIPLSLIHFIFCLYLLLILLVSVLLSFSLSLLHLFSLFTFVSLFSSLFSYFLSYSIFVLLSHLSVSLTFSSHSPCFYLPSFSFLFPDFCLPFRYRGHVFSSLSICLFIFVRLTLSPILLLSSSLFI